MSLARRVFGPEPLARLIHTHAASSAADACVTVSLAGSLFFSVSVDAARPRLALFLLLTLAPFAVVTPLVGPVADRFRHVRPAFVSFTGQGRAVFSLFIAVDLRNLLLYPESFAILVLGKSYSIAKSSLVPTLVTDHRELVAANSRLSRVGSIAAAIGGLGGAGILQVFGPVGVLRVAAIVHLVGAALALRIPRRAELGADTIEDSHDSEGSSAIPLSPAAFTSLATPAPVRTPLLGLVMLRASVGLVTFLLAFALKRAGEPAAFFGVVALAGALGNFAGTFVSPALRRNVVDERWVVAAATTLAAIAAAVAAWQLGRIGMLVAAFGVALSANVGRQGFDSLAQRETREDLRGRLFARFEALLQLAWVVGALVPTIIAVSTRAGLAVIVVAAAVSTVIMATDRRVATASSPSRT